MRRSVRWFGRPSLNFAGSSFSATCRLRTVSSAMKTRPMVPSPSSSTSLKRLTIRPFHFESLDEEADAPATPTAPLAPFLGRGRTDPFDIPDMFPACLQHDVPPTAHSTRKLYASACNQTTPVVASDRFKMG